MLISFNVFRPKITGCLLKQSAVCNSYHSDINTSLVKVKTNMLEKNFKECLHSQNNCALTETWECSCNETFVYVKDTVMQII